MSPSNLPMEQSKINRSASRLFLLCFLSYGCSYIGRKNFAACLPAMIAEGFLTKSMGGYITTAYMIVYGAGQLLSGLFASHIKPKYMIGTGLLGASLCNFLMGITPSPIILPIIWAANGLFHSMLWSPIIRVFTDLLPEERRSSAGTNISASCSIGAVLAFLIPAAILKFGHWRIVFFAAGGLLFLTFMIWVIGHSTLAQYIKMMEKASLAKRRAWQENAQKVSRASNSAKKAPHSLPFVIISSGLWFLLFSLICNGALRDAVESWAPTFLSEQFQLDSSMAALISVVIPVVSLAGTYIANLLYEKMIHNEVYTACIMFCAATLCVTGLFFAKDTNPVICAMLMALSVTAMWGANHMFLTVIPYHFAPLGLSAAVTGFLNCVIYISTALGSGIYGVLAENFGWNILILIWLGVGIAGIILSVLGGRLWAKKRIALNEGRI